MLLSVAQICSTDRRAGRRARADNLCSLLLLLSHFLLFSNLKNLLKPEIDAEHFQPHCFSNIPKTNQFYSFCFVKKVYSFLSINSLCQHYLKNSHC